MADKLFSVVLFPFVSCLGFIRVFVGALFCCPAIYIAYSSVHKLKRLEPTELFASCEDKPCGKYFFSFMVGVMAPYSASISPYVKECNQQECIIIINDWPWLRGPFGAIHAACLANLVELTIGLASLSAVKKAGSTTRGVPIDLNVEYVKKAKGTVICRAEYPTIPTKAGKHRLIMTAEVHDQQGELTTRASCAWLVEVGSSKKE